MGKRDVGRGGKDSASRALSDAELHRRRQGGRERHMGSRLSKRERVAVLRRRESTESFVKRGKLLFLLCVALLLWRLRSVLKSSHRRANPGDFFSLRHRCCVGHYCIVCHAIFIIIARRGGAVRGARRGVEPRTSGGRRRRGAVGAQSYTYAHEFAGKETQKNTFPWPHKPHKPHKAN